MDTTDGFWEDVESWDEVEDYGDLVDMYDELIYLSEDIEDELEWRGNRGA